MHRVIRHGLLAATGGLLVSVGDAAVVIATAGDLNNDFSGVGKVSTDMGHAISTAEAMLVQPDGKVLVAGTPEAITPSQGWVPTAASIPDLLTAAWVFTTSAMTSTSSCTTSPSGRMARSSAPAAPSTVSL